MKDKFLIFAFVLTVYLFAPLDGNAQWVQTSGPSGGRVNCFAVSDTKLFEGFYNYSKDTGGVFRSTDNGSNWIIDSSGMGEQPVLSFAVSDTNLFAGYYNSTYNTSGVFHSTNSGTSWTIMNNFFYGAVDALAMIGTNLFAGGPEGVFRSTDNGTNWSNMSKGLKGNQVIALTVSGTNLFAGSDGGTGISLSTDSGTTWKAVNNGLKTHAVFAFAVSGTNLFAAVAYDGVFRSTDSGTNWTAVNNGLSDTDVRAFAVSGTNLFAGTYGGGVFRSSDNGANWTAVNNGLTDTVVYAFAVSDSNLYAGSGSSGVWRRPLSDFAISSVEQASMTTQPEIHIFPNPLSQSTTISFTPETSGHADVSIVNLLGVEIAHIFSGELAAGNHSFTWNPAGVPDGMYECVVRMSGVDERSSTVGTLPVVMR